MQTWGERQRDGPWTPQKPDLSDAGFGQIGCVFVLVGLAIGVVLSIVIGTYGVPIALADDNAAWLRLIAIGWAAPLAGILACTASAWVVERVPAMWRRGEILAYIAGMPVAAVVIRMGQFVPIAADWVGPLVVAVTVLMVAGPPSLALVRRSMPTAAGVTNRAPG